MIPFSASLVLNPFASSTSIRVIRQGESGVVFQLRGPWKTSILGPTLFTNDEESG